MFNYNNIVHYFPEITILFTIFVQIIYSFINNKLFKKFATITSFLGLFISLVIIFFQEAVSSMMYLVFLKILILLSASIIIWLKTRRIFIKHIIHFNILYLFVTFFSIMILNSENYLSLYLNIELLSIGLYFMYSMDKRIYSLSETIKYMVSSIIASSFLLFGSSFIYGLTGSLNFNYIGNFVTENSNYSLSTYLIPYILILTGLFFKLGVFPFANWMIDIFKNIDTKIVMYVSIIPKIAIFSVLIKIIASMSIFETSLIIIIFSLITGFYASVYGIKTSNLKCIMACSSYLNISYMLIALALFTKFSIATLFFYWITYIFMNIGAFSAILILEYSNLVSVEKLNYEGYFYKNPIISTCFIICIISLLGMPITSGFIAKIYLIAGVLNSGIIVFPLLLMMFSLMVLSTYFYLNVIKKIFTIPSENNGLMIYNDKNKRTNKFILYLCTFIILYIGLLPTWFIKLCETMSCHI